MGIEQFRDPVDALVDSGVDTLLYCVGDTRVLLYDTQVGERWGHNTTDWSTTVWYRAKANLEMARQAGLDPLRVVCERANEKDIRILPTLLLGSNSWEDREKTFHGRCSDFCFDHPEYCIDFEGGRYGFDYNLQEVRDERFAVIEELLALYPTDGVELSFYILQPLCKPDEVDRLRENLTDWMRQIRTLAERCAAEQGREKIIAVRVPAVWDGCHEIGLDLNRWLDGGLLDWLIPHTPDQSEQLDQDMPLEPFVGKAHESGRKIFSAISPLISNDWYSSGTKEMYHAAAANAYTQGVDGVMLLDFWPSGYPWSDEDYGIMRQMGHPDLLKTKDKLFRARSAAGRVFSDEDAPLGYGRPLPATMTAGGRGPEIPIRVSDDLAESTASGRLDRVTLSARVTNICPEDELRFFFNDMELPRELARADDYTYKMRPSAGSLRVAPHYWFDFSLPADRMPHVGHNTLRIDLVARAPALSKFMPVTVHDAEIAVSYRSHRNAPKRPRRFSDA
jgi:hypothetical protein